MLSGYGFDIQRHRLSPSRVWCEDRGQLESALYDEYSQHRVMS
jgi:hypothetical protein